MKLEDMLDTIQPGIRIIDELDTDVDIYIRADNGVLYEPKIHKSSVPTKLLILTFGSRKES